MIGEGIPSLLSLLGMGRSKKSVKRVNMYQTEQPSSGGIPLNATQAGRGALADLYMGHKQSQLEQPGPMIQHNPDSMPYAERIAAEADVIRKRNQAVANAPAGMGGSKMAPSWRSEPDEEQEPLRTWGK